MLKAFLIVILFQVAVSVSQGIALAIAGVIAPILAELLKRWTGASGFTAVILAAAVSAVIAIAATFLAGEAHSLSDVVRNVGAVFALATLVYRAVIAANAPAT